MTIKLTDKIDGGIRGTVDGAMAYARKVGAYDLDFLREMFTELYRLCQMFGWDFAGMVGQSAHETGDWAANNPNWTDLHNPAGLAITNHENKSVVYRSGVGAARAFAVHWWVYLYGPLGPDDYLYPYRSLDGHYDEAATGINPYSGKNNRYAASVVTYADLNPNGQWCYYETYPKAGNRYGDRVVAKANAVWGQSLPAQDLPVTVPPGEDPEPIPPGEGEPMTYNYDNGIVPPWVDFKVSEAAKYAGYIDPIDHIIAALFLHSAYGGLEGTTEWYQGGHALTDAMVGNSFDGAKLNGQLRRFNDAYGNRYAWSSGPTKNPIEDAAKFIELFGPDPECINKYTSACERSCAAVVATNPVTDEEHHSRCLWIAYHANRYGKHLKSTTGEDLFTCDTFPLIPSQNNRSFLIYHGENNEDKRETCPDPHVRATIDRIVADVRVILSGWQKGTTTIPPQVPPAQMPTYAPVKPIDALQAYKGKDADAVPAFVKSGTDTFIFVNDRVRATKATPRYQTANVDGGRIGQDIAKGEEFAVLWLFWDEKGDPWYISPYWTRIRTADTERIRDAA